MSKRIERRQALGAFGTISLGGLVAACSSSSSAGPSPSRRRQGPRQGRTTHIRAKVHIDNATALTTQIYFDDDLSTKVYRGAAYAGRGRRDVLNASDGYLAVMTFDVRSA